MFEDARHDETHERSFETAAEALGLVVVVEALEFDVEFGGELRAGGSERRAWLELDPPFVAAASLAGGGIHEEWGDVEVDDVPLVATTDGGERIGELFFDDVLAERAELELRAAGVDEPGRFDRREAHDIADHVTRQTGRRGEQERVIDSDFDAGEGHGLVADIREVVGVEIGHRQEFVINSGVCHQAQTRDGFRILSGDEGLGSRVNLVEIHAGAEGGAQLFGERADGDAAVDQAFQIGPDALKITGAGLTLGRVGAERFGKDEDPARDAGEQRDIERRSAGGDGGDFGGPIGHLGDGGAGFVEVFLNPRRQIKRGDPAEITGVGLERFGLGDGGEFGRAAEEQMATAEDA